MDYNVNGTNTQQRDIVLSPNEYLFVQSNTNGIIKTYAGPITITISAQDSIVQFNNKTKRFETTNNLQEAKGLFVAPPENWYAILKNPAKNNENPEGGKANTSPELQIGRKVNIRGPVSFALYPGQMAKVVKGHILRSNQYLLARVYDAEAANQNQGKVFDAEGKEIANTTTNCINGQILVIKGTEISFYIPPTGIEVIPVDEKTGNYVRDAVTLERLEYAILKDEDGEKRYVHGPAVVFPKPTEIFVEAPKGGTIFRALELSPISGIYIKVIAAYTDEKGVEHPIGEELFITGKEQMIYYPRPEHAMIQYDGKYMHHAIAIPEGEGRYILNRLTGEIKTVVGPQMYLPDPRKEVVVKRKLTSKECDLIYPNNLEVRAYNKSLSEKYTEKLARKGMTADSFTNAVNNAYSTANQESALAIFEANANISRGVSYTKPRTITLDTKFDGVVGVNVWTGYAINVVDKKGGRQIVVGPATKLLNYDETLEPIILSTGTPKRADTTEQTAYLKLKNNKVSDIIQVQTKDYVDTSIKLYYSVDFLDEFKSKWFNVENYTKYLTDSMRSLLKKEINKYTIHEFYADSQNIIKKIIFGAESAKDKKYNGRLFKDNGMIITDIEILNVSVSSEVAELLNNHQLDMIDKTIQLSGVSERIKLIEAIAEADKKESAAANAKALYEIELKHDIEKERMIKAEAIEARKQAAAQAKAQAELDLQEVLNQVNEAQIARDKAMNMENIALQKELEAIEEAKQKAYAETVSKIMESVTPDLVAALSTKANEELLIEATKNMTPYAIAKGESVADTINTLMRGTSLEGILKDIAEKNN